MSKKRNNSTLWSHPSFSKFELLEKKSKTTISKLPKSKSFNFEKSTTDTTIDLTLSPEKTSDDTVIELKKESKASKKILFKACENWIENFEPQTIEDIAVHNKKLDEVQNFLKHCDFMKEKNQPNQIALFTGPSGAGKTASLKVLAKILGFEIIEWITPVDVEIDNANNNFYSSKENQLTAFKRFIFQSSRYKTLFEASSSKRILLIEDIPNIIIREPDLLIEILEHYKLYGKSPVVFIVTDSKSRKLNLSFNLFPDNIKDKYDITHINFNSVAISLMKKALKRISTEISKEQFKHEYSTLNQETLDSICLSADGDLRNAVINLHFASLKGPKKVQLKTFIERNSKTKKKTTSKKLSSIGRDDTITLMHALGRVLYPKYDEKCLVHSPEVLTDQFSSENKHFVNFIHANYISHFSNIENVTEAADNLSLSDLLMTEYRDNNVGTLGLNIAVRGLMTSNSNALSAWAAIKGPKKQKDDCSYETELKRFNLLCNITKNTFVTDMKSYLSKINKS